MRIIGVSIACLFAAGCFSEPARHPPLNAADRQRAIALDWLLRNRADLSSQLTFCVDVGGQYLTDPPGQPSAALLAPYQAARAHVLPSHSCGPATPPPGAYKIEAHRDSVWVSIGPVLELTDSTALVDTGLWRGPRAAELYRCRIVLRKQAWHLLNCYVAGIS